MKKNNFRKNTIVRNNYLIEDFSERGCYGCKINRIGGGEKHTVLWVGTRKVSAMSNEEFSDMLIRHGVA